MLVRWWSSDATQVQLASPRQFYTCFEPISADFSSCFLHFSLESVRKRHVFTCFHAFSGLGGTRLNFKSAVKEVQRLAYGMLRV